MPKKGLSEFMAEKHALGKAALNSLRLLVDRYPYYHAARLLYLRALYRNHDEDFDSELHKAALFVPSRQVLYAIIEGESLRPSRPSAKAGDGTGAASQDRTATLIDQFLSDTEEEGKPRRQPHVDASVDYLEFLRQNESDSEVFSAPQGTEGQGSPMSNVIDAFLNNQGRLVLHERSDEEMLKPLPDDSSPGAGSVLTETMAKIYIKQQKYDQALEIISKLRLKYPNKSRYFADQIRFLGKVIANDRNK